MTTCVITGAGSGLGRALTLELTGQGVFVAGIGRRREALDETAALAVPGRFVPIVADIGNIAAVDGAFAEITASFGPVDILINNAAVYPHRDFLDISAEAFMQTVSINLGGLVACTAAALRGMVETGEGRILNVATFADRVPLPASAEYSVSKGAAKILTRALVADISDRFPRIIMNDWVPGVLATEMGTVDGIDPALAARWGARLAMLSDPSVNGMLWFQDQEVLPPKSLKQRVFERITLRQKKARRID
ncbi:MAG: oxidoreductase [Ahrensia sp.]|nr:oxidoreductase [Ahrensia sp.]